MDEKLMVLIAELEAQKVEIEAIHLSCEKKAEQLKKDIFNEDLTISLSYKLHNLFSAYEDFFKIIYSFFENQIDDLPKYHSNLLKRMCIEIKEFRPRLLSEQSFKLLDELR